MNQKNFLSRKQIRKQKRQEKKNKMDSFYKNRFKKNEQPNKSRPQQNLKKANNKIIEIEENKKNKKFKELNDEEIVSEEDEIVNNSYEGEEDFDEEENEENFEEENENNYEEIDNKDTELAKLDKEIKIMEKKLGLNNQRKREQYKKRLSQENFDNDILDFLDHIDNIVKEEKTQAKKKKTKVEKKKDIIKEDEEEEEFVEKNEKIKKDEEKINCKIRYKIVNEIKKKSKLFKNMDKESEMKLEFSKQLIGLLNKTSEGNIAIIFDEYNKLIDSYIHKIKEKHFFYEKIANITIKLILEQDIINMNITGCICAFISILHFKLGNNFLVYFLQKNLDIFNKALDFVEKNKDDSWDFTHSKNIIKNFVFIIIHFYIFGNLTSKFYFDIIKLFIDQLNNVTSEMLLILLRHIGIEVRKENPEVIKEIVTIVNKKYNSLVAEEKLNSVDKPIFENKKLKFIVEMIDDIKNNKFLKFNLLEKYSFLKTFVMTNMKNFEHRNSSIDSFKIDLTLNQITNYDISKNDQNQINDKTDRDENQIINVDDGLIDDSNIINTEKLSKMFKKYKINTDLKKKIFTAIVTGVDYLDTFEKLMRLNLSNEQSRDMIKIIVLLIINEKCFNQFYFILLNKLISFNKDHKYTYHFTIWDQLKMMDNFKLKSIHSLAKTTALLLNEEVIGLPCILNFEFENSNEKQFLFILLIFDKYFELTNVDKTKILFAKLVKNDNHVEFGKKLFAYLAKQFVEDINLSSKIETYNENYTAAIKVLKKIL